MKLPKDVFARFDEITDPIHRDDNGRVYIRYPVPRRVGNILHSVCGGVVDEIGKTDVTDKVGYPCWVEDWQCRRCKKKLQGADCKMIHADEKGVVEMKIRKDIARGRRWEDPTNP